MTAEEAKNELMQYRHDLIFIEFKEHEIENLSAKIDALIDSKCGMEEHDLPQLELLYKDYLDSIIKAYRHKLMVENAIENIPQPYKNVLTLLYLEGAKLKDVAEKLSYNYAYTSRLNTLGIKLYADRQSEALAMSG